MDVITEKRETRNCDLQDFCGMEEGAKGEKLMAFSIENLWRLFRSLSNNNLCMACLLIVRFLSATPSSLSVPVHVPILWSKHRVPDEEREWSEK